MWDAQEDADDCTEIMSNQSSQKQPSGCNGKTQDILSSMPRLQPVAPSAPAGGDGSASSAPAALASSLGSAASCALQVQQYGGSNTSLNSCSPGWRHSFCANCA